MKDLRKSLLVTLAAGAFSTGAMAQVNMINPSNVSYAHMGESVAQYSGFSAFGAYEDGADANGKTYTGAVYLFQNGVLHRTFKKSNELNRTAFTGRSVALNDQFLAASVTGGPNQATQTTPRGIVYIAGKTNGAWDNAFKYEIFDAEVKFSTTFPIALDGYGTLAISSPQSVVNGVQSGAVFIYEFVNTNGTGTWVKKQVIAPTGLPEGSNFGASLAIHGGKLIAGAPKAQGGRVFVYTKNGSSWTLQANLTAPVTDFGTQVDITDSYAIVSSAGTNQAGALHFLELNNQTWTIKQTIAGVKANSVAIENSKAVVGADYNLANTQSNVKFYTREWDGWKLKKTKVTTDQVEPLGDAFGYDVDLQGDGVLISRRTADKGSIPNVGAGVLFNFWSAINSNRTENVTAEESLIQDKNLFPNPSTGGNVVFQSADEILKVDVYSQSGEHTEAGFQGNVIQTDQLTPGMYVLHIHTLAGVEVRKLSVL